MKPVGTSVHDEHIEDDKSWFSFSPCSNTISRITFPRHCPLTVLMMMSRFLLSAADLISPNHGSAFHLRFLVDNEKLNLEFTFHILSFSIYISLFFSVSNYNRVTEHRRTNRIFSSPFPYSLPSLSRFPVCICGGRMPEIRRKGAGNSGM